MFCLLRLKGKPNHKLSKKNNNKKKISIMIDANSKSKQTQNFRLLHKNQTNFR